MNGRDAGVRLFARYAHAPNARGYCGPDVGGAFQRVACGYAGAADVARAREAARAFSGAWPYQLLLADLTGRDDPLAEEIGRAYWTGNDLTRALDPARFGRALLDRFAGQAGRYWAYLDDSLLPEVMPTHAFHVLGVYPWSRLLGRGVAEPLMVLDSCRIRTGRVVDVETVDDGGVNTGVNAGTPVRSTTRLRVEADGLEFDGRALRLRELALETVDWVSADGPFIDADTLANGSEVALHWGFACDLLTGEEAFTLRELTAYQLERTNERLRRTFGRE